MTRSLSDSRTRSNASESTTAIGWGDEIKSDTEAELQTSNNIKTPKIFFGSRTHKQLSQIIKELKSTAYKVNMTVLGSRDQYCIHKTVSKAKNKTEEW
jgi:Fanconi anemia group J protein